MSLRELRPEDKKTLCPPMGKDVVRPKAPANDTLRTTKSSTRMRSPKRAKPQPTHTVTSTRRTTTSAEPLRQGPSPDQTIDIRQADPTTTRPRGPPSVWVVRSVQQPVLFGPLLQPEVQVMQASADAGKCDAIRELTSLLRTKVDKKNVTLKLQNLVFGSQLN